MPWWRPPRPATGRVGPRSGGKTRRQSLPSLRPQKSASRRPPARPAGRGAGAGTSGCKTPWPEAPAG
eukprot:9266198-Lingulodinium_polyedra.AAC.1